MSLSKMEIEITIQCIVNEENKTERKINELEELINKEQDDPLGLKDYLPSILEDKKQYNKDLENIRYKLEEELRNNES